MHQYLVIFGISINLYKFFFYLALATVPVVLFAIRKRFGYTKLKALLYSLLTLVFGLLAAWLTATLKRVLLGFASGGEYTDSEMLRNYGIPIFLPFFYLIYCAVTHDNFKKITAYVTPCVYSVMTFVKTGCVFWGCCYGNPDEHGIWSELAGYKTFPVQLYDALTSLLIFIICILLVYNLKEKHYGYIYPVGGILFALTKGFWENFRVHDSVYERNFLGTGWTLWQYWLLVFSIVCIIWIIVTFMKNRKKEA